MEDKLTWSNIDPRTRKMAMIGLALGMLVACLDGTIITTSLPTIAADLNGVGVLAWVFTAYMLCETIMIPIAGKLSDHYGRKPLLLIGISIFLIGSFLGGMSTSMTQLIIFRGLQGIGGGILIPVATASVADFYSPAERGKIQGALGAIFAIGMAAGPLIGGYITDHISWHWCFYINIPIGLAMIALTAKKFPTASVDELHKIDYIGMGILSGLLVDVLLLFTWGGDKFAWLSAETIGMVAIAAVVLMAFVYWEKRADDPVIKLELFKNNIFRNSFIILLIFGMGLMGVMAYLPSFLQVILGYSSTDAGLITIAMVVGMMMTAMSSGVLIRKTGAKPWLIAGPIIAAAGMFLLSTLHAGSDLGSILLYLFITGVGMGCVMSVVMITVQNNSRREEMGMTTSTANLFRSIGSTVAAGLFATFINIHMNTDLQSFLPTDIYNEYPHTTAIMNFLNGVIPTDLLPYVSQIFTAYGDSITFAFFLGAIVTLVVLVFSLLIKTPKGDKIETRVVKEDTTTE